MTKNNEQTKTLVYSYATAGGEAMEKGVTPTRSQGFYFLDNKLVGYEFTSSYKVDNTNFDSTLVSKITKGVSTRDDVARLLGQAGGRYIYPLIPSKEEDAVNYLYGETRGSAFNLKFYQKLLVVTFNKDGIVSNMEFSELGQ